MASDQLKRPPKGTPELYEQDGKGYEAIVHAHYFVGSSDWFITEYDPENDEAFGWACLGGDRMNAELGYVYMPDLGQVRAPLVINGSRVNGVLPVEFDNHWERTTLREAIEKLDR